MVSDVARSGQRGTVRSMNRLAARRGFTILEIVVATAMTSVMLLMMVGWVFTLVNTSSNFLSKNASTSDLSYANTMLSSDFASAVVCDPNGLGVPFYTVTSTQVGIYTPDATTSGQIDLTLWRFVNGQLQRAVLAPDGLGTCTYTTSSAQFVTVAGPLASVVFVPWYQGSQASYPAVVSSGGSCAGAPGTPNAPEYCKFDSLEVQLTAMGTQNANSDPSNTQTLDATFPINLAQVKLGS